MPEPSHVLTAMGYSSENAQSCIRFSVGRFTTEDEVETALEMIRTVLLSFSIQANCFGLEEWLGLPVESINPLL